MFNVGPAEIMMILLLALVVFGPKRLPEIGKTVGKSLREFRKTQFDVKREISKHLSGDGDSPSNGQVGQSKTEGTGSPKAEGSVES
jgi:sec-independent protein translocase protein TatA